MILAKTGFKAPDQQQSSADLSNCSGRGVQLMQAMSRRFGNPFRALRKIGIWPPTSEHEKAAIGRQESRNK